MVVVHLKFLAMDTRKFSASEVLHMLADGDDEELNAFSQRELEQESEDDDEVCGDYIGEDGEQMVIPYDLLDPNVKKTLERLAEDQLPCEIDSLLLCDVELIEDNEVYELDTSPVLFSSPETSNSQVLAEDSISSDSAEMDESSAIFWVNLTQVVKINLGFKGLTEQRLQHIQKLHRQH